VICLIIGIIIDYVEGVNLDLSMILIKSAHKIRTFQKTATLEILNLIKGVLNVKMVICLLRI
jgi:uncharacterized membrane protein